MFSHFFHFSLHIWYLFPSLSYQTHPSLCMSFIYKLNSLHHALPQWFTLRAETRSPFASPSSPKAKVFEMEVLNPIEGKTYKLPVGYRFDPSDEILAGYYLRKRIMAQPLPNDLIQDCDVYQTVPWELPGGWSRTQTQILSFHLLSIYFLFFVPSDFLVEPKCIPIQISIF